ncbi:MAG: hypothetical protein H7A51_18125 [Akkermansiaceae bacterium]|nr:hypothetical protein [Akkermansiaceae bacterium]
MMRARAMTPEQRLEECFLLSDEALQQSLAGAMWQLGTEDVEEGWLEVKRRMDRLDSLRDRHFYSTNMERSV